MPAITLTILDGDTDSDELFAGLLRQDGNSILGFRFPLSWPSGVDVNILESAGIGGTYRPLCDLDSDPVLITDPSAGAFPNGKTIKDASIPAIFYGITAIKLQASAAVTGDQEIEVITDVL